MSDLIGSSSSGGGGRRGGSGRSGSGGSTTLFSLLLQALLLIALLPATTTADNAGNYLYDGDDDAAAAGVVDFQGTAEDLKALKTARVVEFYSPYCGHCIHYKPDYITLAREVHDTVSPDIEFLAVSCAAHGDVCRAFKVKEYPSVFAFHSIDSGADDGADENGGNGKALKAGSRVTVAGIAEAFPELLGGKAAAKLLSRHLSSEEGDDEGDGEDDDEEEDEDEEVEDNFSEDKDGSGEEDVDEEGEGGDDAVDPVEEDSEADDDDKAAAAAAAAAAVGGGGSEDGDGDGDGSNEDAAEDKSDDEDKDSPASGYGGGGEEDDDDTEAAAGGGSDHSGDGSGDAEDDDENPGAANRGDDDDAAGVKDEDGSEDEDEDEDGSEDEDSEDEGSGSEEDDEEDEDEDGSEDEDSEDEGSGSEEDDEEDEDDDNAIVNKRPKFAGKKGAEAAKKAFKDIDRWKDRIAEHRERTGRLGRGVRLPHRHRGGKDEPVEEGATTTMKENRAGTREYESRKEQLLESIRRHKGRSRAKQVEESLAAPRKLPYKKHITKPKFVEKLPMMGRLAKMSSEEEMILDVTLSFMHGLRVGVYRSNEALSGPQKKALADWLSMLRISLPQEWALHDLIDDLLDNIDIVAKRNKNLELVIDRHPIPRVTWSRSCGGINKAGGGFTCGFWKLLHTSTVGMAEYRGGINLKSTRTLRKDAPIMSPEGAADVIREYMANFFPCTECATHFTRRYDDCSYRRCHRLTDDADLASDADWKQLGTWLWEFHNEVNVRLLHEQSVRAWRSSRLALKNQAGTGPGVDDEIRVLWPSLNDCVTCYREDGSWNDDGVFIHLERIYWPAPAMDSKAASLLKFETDADPEWNLTMLLVLIGILLLYALRQSLFSPNGLKETMLKARTLGPRGVLGAQKRSV